MPPRSDPDALLPSWFGRTYPTQDDLLDFAWDLGAAVTFGRVSKGAYFPANPDYGEDAVLVVPDHDEALPKTWSLAHEVGHLVLHLGYTSPWTRAKQETQAERWGACALIPQERIRAYKNASVDAFIAALSRHYQDVPAENSPIRRLAARIAKIRLQALNSDPVSGQIQAYRG